MQIPRKMSAQNVMASISRTLGTRHHQQQQQQHNTGDDKSNPDAPPPPPQPGTQVKLAGEESKDRLYEPKHKQKLVRVLTVVAYIISVSLAAIVLSLYYMYIWDPSDNSHYLAKMRQANMTSSNSSAGAAASLQATSTVLTLCLEIGQAVASEERLEGSSTDKTAAISTTTESFRSASSESPNPSQASKSLYKTLTTPSNRRDEDYMSSTDQPDRFALGQRPNSDDYQDGTIVPADEVLDD